MAIPKEWRGIHPDFVPWARIDQTVEKTFGKKDLSSPSWQAFALLAELLSAKMAAEQAIGETREAAERSYAEARSAVASATADEKFSRTCEDVKQRVGRLQNTLLQSLRPRLMEFPNADQMAERHLAKSMKRVKDKLEGKGKLNEQQLL